MEKSKRNRAATIERIMDALGEVLGEHGIEELSINAVAEKAGVSKVLIYRYFGGLESMLEYYIGMGRLIPHFSPTSLEKIQPTRPNDLAPIWSAQTLQLFRQFRTSRSSRELLKATVKSNDSLADAVSEAQDIEFTNLVDQLAFVKGSDYQATSAVILGGLSYLTIQAQLNRPAIGLNLRGEKDWQRIEEAVKIIYKALNNMAVESPTTHLDLEPVSVAVSAW